MATYSDNFNRANGALGSDWAELSWSDQTASIISNAAARSQDGASGNAAHRYVGGGTWGREQYSEVVVNATSSDRAGPAVYMSDAGGGYYLRCRCDGFTFYQIMKVPNTGGDGTQLASGNWAVGLADGDILRIKVEDNGTGNTLITVTKNGGEADTYTDSSSPITSGNPGFILEQYWRVNFPTWTGDDFAAAAEDTVTTVVGDQAGTPLTNLTGITWWWQESAGGAIVDSGTGETTNASGVMEVNVTNTVLTTGQTGYISVELSDGNVGIKKDQVD